MGRKIFSAWPVALALAGAGLAVVIWWLIPLARGDYRTTPEFRKMELTEITVVTPAGQEIKLAVRLADEQDEQLAGFQHIGRKVMAQSLILFVFPREISGKFHMRNVAAPLDIAFLRDDGGIFEVLRMEPGLELYGPPEPFKYALEAPAGFFSAQGIGVGSRLNLPPD